MMTSNASPIVPLGETFERLRVTSNMSSPQWLELLNLSWNDYQNFKISKYELPEKSLENVAKYFSLTPEQITNGGIDYRNIAVQFEKNQAEMPELYAKAAFGRKRTSITSLDFVEKFAGWRLRLDSIRQLNVAESLLQDPFSSISMRFITDLCSYLYKRQFQKSDFFAMGAFTYEGNKDSVVGKLFAEMPSPQDAYEFFFQECMKLFEQNCIYTITRMGENSLSVEYITNPYVAAESGVRHLGNTHVCQVKMGLIANIPRYLGLPASKIKEVSCVHTGDNVCCLEVDFSDANRAQLNRSALSL
ncbi:MAG: hypothetical protein ACXWQQ_07635 [Pseudobdellovibrio sp.]